MGSIFCLLVCYLYLQAAIFLNSRKLLEWDNPQWQPESFEKRQKESRKLFSISWITITLFTFSLDVGILFYGIPAWLDVDGWTKLRSLPFLLIPLMLTFIKAPFLHLLWLTWSIERLKDRLKEND